MLQQLGRGQERGKQSGRVEEWKAKKKSESEKGIKMPIMASLFSLSKDVRLWLQLQSFSFS
jgi:hypothetical protein